MYDRSGKPAPRRRELPARAITYTVVALLAFAALRGSRPDAPPRPGEVLVPAAPEPEPLPELVELTDTLRRGQSLVSLLAARGLREEASAALQAAPLDERRIPAGMPVIVRQRPTDSLPNEVVFQLGVDRVVRLVRGDSGWVGREETLAWTTDTVAVAGTISSTLFQALDEGAALLPQRARAELAYTVADILEYRVDMSRDLQVGDAFKVLFERETLPTGAVRIGRVLATNFRLSGDEVSAFHYLSRTTSGKYFDAQGKSLRAAFLRAPLEFRRISSVFGVRRHPILGTMKAHKGTDYAASSGTPVRAIGDGVIIRANYHRGYGNVLEVRHRNGYVSRYGHLRGFRRGVRVGTRVTVGETIGYVGSTGLSTGPHLHFEMLVGGQQRDSRKVLAQLKGGEPIARAERAAFEAERQRLLETLATTATGAAPTVATGVIED
jgi:murein DD-endopeptidase MepM/ murein hydrolase activator NlpD